MIAVWLVGPPSSVTMPTTWSRSRVAVSAGARSLATMIVGLSSAGRPGSGTPEHLGDDPVADVPQVGDPLGQVRAAGLEDLAEAFHRLIDGGRRTGAGVDPPLHVGQISPGSWAISEVASSTAAVAAWAAAARTRRLLATYSKEVRHQVLGGSRCQRRAVR